MLTEQDVYVSFRVAQSKFLSRPYRIPKSWDSFVSKMSENNRLMLETVTGMFNTKWNGIDIEEYFLCGFELFKKNFTYIKFLNEKIMLLYIDRDLNRKKENLEISDTLKKDIIFIKSWMATKKHRNDMSLLKQYCNMRDEGQKAPIRHYILNKINKITLIWLMSGKILSLTDEEIPLIQEVYKNYWSFSVKVIRSGIDHF